MKVLLTPALFIFFSISSLTSQATFGIKGGPNLSVISIESSKCVLLFHAGVFGEIPVSENFLIRPELQYSRKGTMQNIVSEYSLDFAFSYLSLPVLIGWNTLDRLTLLMGPEFSYMLDGRLYTYDDQVVIDDALFEDWDMAIDFGVAYQISKKFSAEFRYSLGLCNVIEVMFTDLHGRPIGSLDEGKNRTIQLSLNYVLASTHQDP